MKRLWLHRSKLQIICSKYICLGVLVAVLFTSLLQYYIQGDAGNQGGGISDIRIGASWGTYFTHSKDNNYNNFIWDRLLSQNVIYCPNPSPDLEGPQLVTFEKPSMQDIESRLPNLEIGGKWRPQKCQSKQGKTALIIPYRDRPDHLRIFLNYIHPILQRQLLDYTVFIIEQAPGSRFNRGMLLNIGFVESLKQDKYQCVIFHDVDLLPEDDRNLYTCTEGTVLHLSAHVDEFAYRLPYHGIMGGAVSFFAADFAGINGFCNQFFGWGGEDDDLFNRIKYHGLNVTRNPKDIARYKMIRHRKIHPNNDRFQLLQTGDRRFLTDGLNSLTYDRLIFQKHHLFTHIYVRVNDTGSHGLVDSY